MDRLILEEGGHENFTPALAQNQSNPELFEPLCPTAEFLMDLNRRRSKQFRGEPHCSERERYAALHPTEILAFKCMDGRLSLDLMTNIPNGIIDPYRNVAGRFDLGWPKLREEIALHVREATNRGHRIVALCAYHFSEGCRERGCRGMNFDTDAARGCAEHLAEQFRSVFEGGLRAAVFPIVIGIETDAEALVIHGYEYTEGSATNASIYHPKGHATMFIKEFAAAVPDEAAIRTKLTQMFPGLEGQLLDDLLPILVGNAAHVHRRQLENVPIISLDHRETVIAVGIGFDWLHVPNRALVIGPYDHQWTRSVLTAASVVSKNIDNGVVAREDGIVLIASSYCAAAVGSWRWKMAEMTSRYIARASQQALVEEGTLLAKTKVFVLAGVVEKSTLKFYPIV